MGARKLEPLETFLVAPFGRAGLARSASVGDAVTVEYRHYGDTVQRCRVTVVPRCSDAEHGGEFLCVSCGVFLVNRFQLEEHSQSGVHYVAQWCAACERWETCLERPASPPIFHHGKRLRFV